MKTEIRKYGNSACILLTKEYLRLYKFKIGQIIEVRINRVSSGSHPHNKQKPLILSKKEFKKYKEGIINRI